MDKEVLGTVVSTMEGPSPSRIDFVINNGKAHKGMFVELEYSEGTMIAMVDELIKTNRYFERPDSVKAIGDELEKNFPAADWEFLIAKAKPLGVFTEKLIQRSTFPASPGTKVYVAENDHIKKFLKLEDDGLNLGQIQFHDVAMKLNMSKLLQKHLALIAQSGAGKSYCVSVILEELLNRTKEQGQLAVIAFDTHGEYTCFGEPTSEKKDFSSKTKVIDGSKIKLSLANTSQHFLEKILSSLTSVQKRELFRIINKLKKEMKNGVGPFGIDAIRAEINELDAKQSIPLGFALDQLEKMSLFSKVDSPAVMDLIKPGELLVIDLNKIINQQKKQLIVAYFASKLFNARRVKKAPPFTMLVEEAHNFIPEGAASEFALARPILQTIAREGRKFCSSLILVSQRPKRLDTTTLANCNTHIILRVTNPYDLDHIKQSSEGLDSNSTNMISSLRVGEAMIVGEAVSAPTFFKVRERESSPSKHEITLEDAAKNYSFDTEKQDEEADAFL